MQTALNRAVDGCIEKGILKEFLLKNRSEVLEMLLEEFDAEKYERTMRSEGREFQKRLFVEFGLEDEKKERNAVFRIKNIES